MRWPKHAVRPGGTGAANKDAKKELKENGREFDVSFTPDMDVDKGESR